MQTEKRSIKRVIDTDYRTYSMYVLENRAIPSAIDGLKSVTRKLLYAMEAEGGRNKKKVSDIGGGLSKYGYHHGETSAMGAAVGMASDWDNNAPLFTGHGNFGSRLIQEAAAARYIFITLSENYNRWFIDTEVAPKSIDEEAPEPAHYLPIIPWVLINGTSGIAVGFASCVLPRSIKDVSAAVKKCIADPVKFLKQNAPIAPTFPSFKGEVVDGGDGSWKTRGIISYAGKYVYEITELPIGYDREKYVSFLNGLVDDGLIKDYDDNCSDAGFGFSIKVSGEQRTKIDKDPIKYFKLEKSHSENLTTLGADGKLKIFDSVAQLIHYFVEYRTSKFAEKLEYECLQLENKSSQLADKIKFIGLVIDGKVDFKKVTKEQLLHFIFTKVTEADYGKRFANIPLYECTADVVANLKAELEKTKTELKALKKVTAVDRYLEVLK